MDETHAFDSFKLYHPRGVQVTFSRPPQDDLIAFIDGLLGKGWLVNAPNGAAGQKVEEIAFAARRQTKKGSPAIDLYIDSDALNFRLFTLYIDNDDMADDFEAATGIKVMSLPLFEGDAALQRDSSNAPKYIKPLARKAKIVLEPNPAYDPKETDISKKKPQWKFVRWDGIGATRPTPPPANGNGKPEREADAGKGNGASGKKSSKLDKLGLNQAQANDLNAYATSLNLTNGDVFAALGISRWGEYKDSFEAAKARLDVIAAERIAAAEQEVPF